MKKIYEKINEMNDSNAAESKIWCYIYLFGQLKIDFFSPSVKSTNECFFRQLDEYLYEYSNANFY